MVERPKLDPKIMRVCLRIAYEDLEPALGFAPCEDLGADDDRQADWPRQDFQAFDCGRTPNRCHISFLHCSG